MGGPSLSSELQAPVGRDNHVTTIPASGMHRACDQAFIAAVEAETDPERVVGDCTDAAHVYLATAQGLYLTADEAEAVASALRKAASTVRTLPASPAA